MWLRNSLKRCTSLSCTRHVQPDLSATWQSNPSYWCVYLSNSENNFIGSIYRCWWGPLLFQYLQEASLMSQLTVMSTKAVHPQTKTSMIKDTFLLFICNHTLLSTVHLSYRLPHELPIIFHVLFSPFRYLYSILQKIPQINPTNCDTVVEVIRQTTEILIWGDQNDASIME